MNLKEFLTITNSIANLYSALELRLLNKDGKSLFRIKTADDTLIYGESKQYFPELGDEIFAISNVDVFNNIIISASNKNNGDIDIIKNPDNIATDIKVKTSDMNISYRLASKSALSPYPMINLQEYEVTTDSIEVDTLTALKSNQFSYCKVIDSEFIFDVVKEDNKDILVINSGNQSSHNMKIALPVNIHLSGEYQEIKNVKFNIIDLIKICDVVKLTPNIQDIKLKLSNRGLLVVNIDTSDLTLDIKRRGAI